MTTTTQTVIDRYIELMDRAIHEPEALTELPSIFAPDATVHLEDLEPVTGIAAITSFYRMFFSRAADNKHVWTTTVLDDGTLECRFLAASRTADGRLVARSGIEHATVDAQGLITTLRANSVILS